MSRKDHFNSAGGVSSYVGGDTEQPMNVYASNVHATGARALELAALEQAGVGIIQRVTGGSADGLGGNTRKDRGGNHASVADAFAAHALSLHQQQWGSRQITIGGMQLTNDNALSMLQLILQDRERAANVAVAKGLIQPEQADEMHEFTARLGTLLMLERRGDLDEEGRTELRELSESDMARVVMEVGNGLYEDLELGQGQSAQYLGTMADYQDAVQHHGLNMSTDLDLAGVSTVDEPSFAQAPSLRSAFIAGNNATQPLDLPAEPAELPSVTADLNARGFDF